VRKVWNRIGVLPINITFQYVLLSDADNNVRKLYGVSSTLGVPGRVTFVIDKKGIVKHVFSSQLHFIKHAKEALLALRV
jgi:peroxiredoxin Q/BCP